MMNLTDHEVHEKDCYNNRKELMAAPRVDQYLTKVVTHNRVAFLKVPTNFEGVPFKLQRLYVIYLDCKAQTIEGVFKNPGNRKWGESTRQYYRRAIKKLIQHGWANQCTGREVGDISLRSYPYVWRSLGIDRFALRNSSRLKEPSRISDGMFFSYFKIWVDQLGEHRSQYYQHIHDRIRQKIAKRKRVQIKWRLRNGRKYVSITQATFAAKSAALLFGYRSSSSGSKLRKKYFSVLPTTEKPGFNPIRGRWEEPTKSIAL